MNGSAGGSRSVWGTIKSLRERLRYSPGAGAGGGSMDDSMSMSASVTNAKGLYNPTGHNNCFLNSAVQVLWQLDVFRKSFALLSEHACLGHSCIFCALKVIFTQFQFNSDPVLPPDALRRAMAQTFVDQQRFQLGDMDDAAECFENILRRIHYHLSNGSDDDACELRHCITHQKFTMTLVEQSTCLCGEMSEPLSYVQLVQYISTHSLVQAKGKFPALSFGSLLREAFSDGKRQADCPVKCGRPGSTRRTLMSVPAVVSVGLIWNTAEPTTEEIRDLIDAVGVDIKPREMFDAVSHDVAASSFASLKLVGVVCYYGKHYSTFFFHSKKKIWISFDDAAVTELGSTWDTVVAKCVRGRYQPLLLLYQNGLATPISLDTAPKMTIMLNNYVPKIKVIDPPATVSSPRSTNPPNSRSPLGATASNNHPSTGALASVTAGLQNMTLMSPWSKEQSASQEWKERQRNQNWNNCSPTKTSSDWINTSNDGVAGQTRPSVHAGNGGSNAPSATNVSRAVIPEQIDLLGSIHDTGSTHGGRVAGIPAAGIPDNSHCLFENQLYRPQLYVSPKNQHVNSTVGQQSARQSPVYQLAPYSSACQPSSATVQQPPFISGSQVGDRYFPSPGGATVPYVHWGQPVPPQLCGMGQPFMNSPQAYSSAVNLHQQQQPVPQYYMQAPSSQADPYPQQPLNALYAPQFTNSPHLHQSPNWAYIQQPVGGMYSYLPPNGSYTNQPMFTPCTRQPFPVWVATNSQPNPHHQTLQNLPAASSNQSERLKGDSLLLASDVERTSDKGASTVSAPSNTHAVSFVGSYIASGVNVNNHNPQNRALPTVSLTDGRFPRYAPYSVGLGLACAQPSVDQGLGYAPRPAVGLGPGYAPSSVGPGPRCSPPSILQSSGALGNTAIPNTSGVPLASSTVTIPNTDETLAIDPTDTKQIPLRSDVKHSTPSPIHLSKREVDNNSSTLEANSNVSQNRKQIASLMALFPPSREMRDSSSPARLLPSTTFQASEQSPTVALRSATTEHTDTGAVLTPSKVSTTLVAGNEMSNLLLSSTAKCPNEGQRIYNQLMQKQTDARNLSSATTAQQTTGLRLADQRNRSSPTDTVLPKELRLEIPHSEQSPEFSRFTRLHLELTGDAVHPETGLLQHDTPDSDNRSISSGWSVIEDCSPCADLGRGEDFGVVRDVGSGCGAAVKSDGRARDSEEKSCVDGFERVVITRNGDVTSTSLASQDEETKKERILLQIRRHIDEIDSIMAASRRNVQAGDVPLALVQCYQAIDGYNKVSRSNELPGETPSALLEEVRVKLNAAVMLTKTINLGGKDAARKKPEETKTTEISETGKDSVKIRGESEEKVRLSENRNNGAITTRDGVVDSNRNTQSAEATSVDGAAVSTDLIQLSESLPKAENQLLKDQLESLYSKQYVVPARGGQGEGYSRAPQATANTASARVMNQEIDRATLGSGSRAAGRATVNSHISGVVGVVSKAPGHALVSNQESNPTFVNKASGHAPGVKLGQATTGHALVSNQPSRLAPATDRLSNVTHISSNASQTVSQARGRATVASQPSGRATVVCEASGQGRGSLSSGTRKRTVPELLSGNGPRQGTAQPEHQ